MITNEVFNIISDTQLILKELLVLEEKDPIIEVIIKNFLEEFADIISKGTTDVDNTKVVEFKVETTHEVPVFSNYIPRRSLKEPEWISQQVKKLKNVGIIRDSTSFYSALIVVIRKKDRDKCITVNFGALNNITSKWKFPMLYSNATT